MEHFPRNELESKDKQLLKQESQESPFNYHGRSARGSGSLLVPPTSAPSPPPFKLRMVMIDSFLAQIYCHPLQFFQKMEYKLKSTEQGTHLEEGNTALSLELKASCCLPIHPQIVGDLLNILRPLLLLRVGLRERCRSEKSSILDLSFP